MAKITISESGCRGCTMCVDVCPVDVFDFDEELRLARVARERDCIGCLSCSYQCPSCCLEVDEVKRLRPFHRIPANVAFLQRFLQTGETPSALTAEDLAEAHRDVAARLRALAHAVVETMGRGHKAVGRRAGVMAAAHLPEVDDVDGVEVVRRGLSRQLQGAFECELTVSGDEIRLQLEPCALCQVVTAAGETVGEAVLCDIFHEYLAGLLTTYLGATYRSEVIRAGARCELGLSPLRR